MSIIEGQLRRGKGIHAGTALHNSLAYPKAARPSRGNGGKAGGGPNRWAATGLHHGRLRFPGRPLGSEGARVLPVFP
eukprot:2614426-Pyramimonas_sp.AAC.1